MTIRLNKVTRDLNVGITTVVDFLQKKGYSIEASPNAKITEEQYAALVKEFSKDKDLKMKSEKIIQQRQGKDRNRNARVAEESQAKDSSAEQTTQTLEPEDVRPKLKPVGKIDLDALNRKSGKATAVPAPEQTLSAEAPKQTFSSPKEEVEKVVSEPTTTEEPKVNAAESIADSPITADKEPKEKNENKAEELKPERMEEEKKDNLKAEQTAQQDNGDEVFKIRPTEFKSKINVVGQIDLAALNQSTRPKKKSKEEKRKEREEKDKQRQEQRKQMKDAIIREIRKTDEKTDKMMADDGTKKKKRNRINKERVDINATGNMGASPVSRADKNAAGKSDAKQGSGKHAKDRFRKPVVKTEVSDEDVARQVKETLARLTGKTKSKASKYRKEKRENIQNRQLEQEELELEESKVLKLTEFVTANELANMMDVPVTQIISTCMSVGIMVSINQRLDAETINLVAEEFGYKTEYVSAEVAQPI